MRPLNFRRLPRSIRLANEIGINLAVESRDNGFKALIKAEEGSSNRVGICADLNAVADSFEAAKKRLIAVRVRPASTGVARFFIAAFRSEVKPLYISVEDPNAGSGH